MVPANGIKCAGLSDAVASDEGKVQGVLNLGDGLIVLVLICIGPAEETMGVGLAITVTKFFI